MSKQYEWTFHCHPDACSWECLITPDDGPVERLVSKDGNLSRFDAVRDAKRHGFDRHSENHHIRFKGYC